MSEAISQPVDDEPQPPPNSKLVYAGIGVAVGALALGGAALGISLAQPHVSPAQAQAYAGSAGSSALTQANHYTSNDITNLNKKQLPQMGVCFNYDTSTDEDGSVYVSSVDVTAPTSTNGVLSCPTGTFISLTPTTASNN
jgi:hypothetical protein